MVFTLNVKIWLAHTIDNRNFNWENLKVVKDIHRKNKIILSNFYLITFIENMFHSNGENVGPKNAIWLTAKRICAQHLKRNRVVCKTQEPFLPAKSFGWWSWWCCCCCCWWWCEGDDICERAFARWFAATLMAAASDSGGGKNAPPPLN